MYFKRIDIQGFKSFAEPVSIEFHEGITCIVGPNGSGKSNISDAIRWVLGEQSPKMLRGGKMEEVIFAGTASRRSRGMAEVTLIIDNGKRILPIDYSEVAITRRMYRSGESGYFINKVPCRLRDIRELIMDTGIGVDGYSIIGQGRIADILSDKPESRREIFEEAAGIVKYRSKKEESERKLGASKNNLDRVNDIVNEIESRIDGLKEDSIKAAEFLKLRDKHKDIEVNITLKNIESLELKNEYISDDITELNNLIEEGKSQKESIDTDVLENRARSEELEESGNTSRDRLLTIIEEANALSSQNRLTREKVIAVEKEKSRLEDEIKALSERKEKEEKYASEVRTNLEKIRTESESLKAAANEISSTVESLESAAAEAQRQIDAYKDDIYGSYSLAAEKKSEIKSLISLSETLEKRKIQITSERKSRDEASSGLEAELKKLTSEKDMLSQELSGVREKIIQLTTAHEGRTAKEKRISSELGENKIAAGRLQARLKMIEEMENAYEGYNEAVKFIMGSDLEGIHGVVADLIAVPEGFEKAVETALGAALQNIVCDNDGNAQIAIDILKKNRVGRLTFLPLSGIKSYAGNLPGHMTKEPGFKGFGVDCVKFDNKYKRIMDYLLGRIVVVDRLEHAVKMSKLQGTGGLRFVTLEGDVVNASGAITGGAYRNKTAGLLERKAEVKVLSAKLQKVKQEQNQLAEELEALGIALEDDKKAVSLADAKYREIEMSLLNKENESSRLSSDISDMGDQRTREERELASIKAELESAAAMIKELQEAVTYNERRIAESEASVDVKLEHHVETKQKLEESKEELTRTRLLSASAASEKNNAEQALIRTDEYISEFESQVEKKKEEIIGLEDEKNRLNAENKEREGLIASKEAEKSATEEGIHRITEEKSRVIRYLNEIQGKKENLDNVISGHQVQKHELELKLTKNETQIEGYKEKLWEDFEISYLQAMDFAKKDFVMSAAVRENREIKGRMKELGEVNIGAIKEYESVKERHEFLTAQRDDLLSAMDSLAQIIEDMDRNIKKNFKESFDQVVVNFEESFKALFGGGIAELRLADESRPLETGIDIIVQPPGKKLQNISLLSGGEKTLTAIALMFAILRTKPTPFCILDEVEAALDEANIDRFARYLKDFKEIQFTLVTHQKATMEYADVLYGVTMPEGGISKVISLKMGDKIEL